MIKEFISPRTGKKIIVQMDDISPVEKEIMGIRLDTSMLRKLNKCVFEHKAISMEDYLELDRRFREREAKEIKAVLCKYAKEEKRSGNS